MPSSPPVRRSTSSPGLLEMTDNVDQLQGVVAHEVGHVVGGEFHRRRKAASSRRPVLPLLSLVLGAVAIAAGGGTPEWAS